MVSLIDNYSKSCENIQKKAKELDHTLVQNFGEKINLKKIEKEIKKELRFLENIFTQLEEQRGTLEKGWLGTANGKRSAYMIWGTAITTLGIALTADVTDLVSDDYENRTLKISSLCFSVISIIATGFQQWVWDRYSNAEKKSKDLMKINKETLTHAKSLEKLAKSFRTFVKTTQENQKAVNTQMVDQKFVELIQTLLQLPDEYKQVFSPKEMIISSVIDQLPEGDKIKEKKRRILNLADKIQEISLPAISESSSTSTSDETETVLKQNVWNKGEKASHSNDSPKNENKDCKKHFLKEWMDLENTLNTSLNDLYYQDGIKLHRTGLRDHCVEIKP